MATENKGEGKKVPAPDMPRGGARSADSKA